jgi:site-specific recombinase XerC
MGCRRRVLYGKTKRDVMQALDELRDLSRRGALVLPEKLTLREFLGQWLDSIVRPNARPSTHAQYRSLMANHVVPMLGGMRLTQLQPIHLIQLQRHLEDKGASPRMRHAVHTHLHRALQQAVKLQLIPFNPSAAVDPPRFTAKVMQPLQPGQASQLLSATAGTRLSALYVLALTSGMRQGELCAV